MQVLTRENLWFGRSVRGLAASLRLQSSRMPIGIGTFKNLLCPQSILWFAFELQVLSLAFAAHIKDRAAVVHALRKPRRGALIDWKHRNR